LLNEELLKQGAVIMARMNQGEDNSAQGSATGAAEQVRSQVSEVAGQVRDAAREKFEHLRDGAADYYEQGREKAQEWQHGVEQYVQEQPIKALLIAAGVGVLLGILWKRS
jgi:ElaB/YqjD/DUF883 family membrane-anchored ribosome-binding protein